MARAIPLFRLADIRVTLDPSWFLIFLLVAYSLAVGYLPQQLPEAGAVVHWALGAVLAAALFLSVVAHEYSHALVARRRGGEVDEIMLFVFGGVAKLKSEPEDAASEFLVAVAGPVLSIVLGAGFLLAVAALSGIAAPSVITGLQWLGWINLALAVFNLVPGFPLDGGRILRAILWWRMGDFEDATVGAARTGQVIAGILVVSGVGLTVLTGVFSWLWEALIGWFLWSAASQSIRLARLRDAVEGVPVRELMTDRVPAIRADHDIRTGLAQTSAGEYPEIAVIDRDGTLVGVVTQEALTEAAEENPERLAREIASPPDDVQLVDPDEDAQTLVTRLSTLGGKLPLVVEAGELIGTIDPRSLVASFREKTEGGPTPSTKGSE